MAHKRTVEATRFPERMKVAIVTVRHDPQDDRIYFKEALSLARRMEVVLIGPDQGQALTWDPRVSYHSIPRRRGGMGRLWSMVEAVRAVCRVNPDFCHVHDLELSLALPFLRLFTRAKLIYDSHEVFTRQDILLRFRERPWIGRPLAWVVERAENILVRCCHHIVTAVEPDGLAFRGLRVPVRTIFNYPPLAMFDTAPAAVEIARQRHPGRLPVVYQGTMSRKRGVFQMLDAVALVKQKEPRIVLKLIGLTDGDLKTEIEERIQELSLSDDVEITGWLRHELIAVEMRASLIGLVPLQPNPKYDRALPIKLLEYMATGLPVVAARLPLMERYIRESDSGVVCDSSQPEDLACAILGLLNEPERCRRMGENGLRAVREWWNWGRMEVALFEVYEALGAPIVAVQT
ncbi:MAG: glycosyltransferase family 4 protein [Kiritimatiellia bacterium]|jgi:glycosyltransferase involved in cell wall biosynthesis|nr:glycosyltransferase family 4 protein [Kiritimatiellia bacterium]